MMPPLGNTCLYSDFFIFETTIFAWRRYCGGDYDSEKPCQNLFPDYTCVQKPCEHQHWNKHANLDDAQKCGWRKLGSLYKFPSVWRFFLHFFWKCNPFFNGVSTVLICCDIQTRRTPKKNKKIKKLENQKKRTLQNQTGNTIFSHSCLGSPLSTKDFFF